MRPTANPSGPGVVPLPSRSSLRNSHRPWFRRWWIWLLIVVIAGVSGFLLGRALSPVHKTGMDGSRSAQQPVSSTDGSQSDLNQSKISDESAGSLALTSNGYPTFETQIVEGTGDQVLSKLTLPGPVALSFDCPNCEGEVGLQTNIPDDPEPISTQGPFAGTIVVAIGDTLLEDISVVADGTWTMLLQDLDSLPKIAGNMDAMGVNSFIYTGNSTEAKVTHTGGGPFSLNVYGVEEPLAVDVDGDYDGVVNVVRGVISIRTEGMWSFSPVD